jgi:MinD-like ATPase involved in chromosome partitioning or flagellar assembly
MGTDEPGVDLAAFAPRAAAPVETPVTRWQTNVSASGSEEAQTPAATATDGTGASEPAADLPAAGQQVTIPAQASAPAAAPSTPHSAPQPVVPDSATPGQSRAASPIRGTASVPETPDALTPERLLRRRTRVPGAGWRRAVYKLTAGLWNPGLSPQELELRRLETLVAGRISGKTRYVAVLARKGGVGKTTTAALLGKTMASLRQDRIVALDANPDRGTLADRVPRQTTATIWDAVWHAVAVQSFAEMTSLVSRDSTRLDVLASETNPRRARTFAGAEYQTVAELLRRYYSIVVTDCGTDFTHDVMPAVLYYSDAVVVVAGAAYDEARLASETLDLIASLGYPDLANNAVVAVQCASQSSVDVTALEEHFGSRARAVVRFPRDEHLAEGSVIDLDRLAPATRRAALQLASQVVAGISDDVQPAPRY